MCRGCPDIVIAHLIRRKLVRVRIRDPAGHEVDAFAGVCSGHSRQRGAVRVEDDQVPTRHEGHHVGQVVAAVEAHTKAACVHTQSVPPAFLWGVPSAPVTAAHATPCQ